ncbi:Protein of unknown function [Gryllus bimaculatus]|nr:Protein of unknown function [Gryllus bimaculatus]
MAVPRIDWRSGLQFATWTTHHINSMEFDRY